MKKIRHSVLPITLTSDDDLDYQELKTISLQMTYKSMSGGHLGSDGLMSTVSGLVLISLIQINWNYLRSR